MQSPSKPLVVITGASSGIGAATAQAFSLAGYPLLLLARRLPEMEALHLPNTLCRQADVLDRAAIKSAIAEAEDRFGPVEFLINNAGIMLNGDPAQQSPEEWDQMIDVNLKGVMNGIHAVLPAMVAREGGTIVNIGSIAAERPSALIPSIVRPSSACMPSQRPFVKRCPRKTSDSSPSPPAWWARI